MFYENTIYPINPHLKKIIHSYWILKSDTDNIPFLLPPDKYFHLILSFKDNTKVIYNDKIEQNVKGSFLLGMQSSYVYLKALGKVDYLAIQFYPHSLRTFLNFSCRELRDDFYETALLKNKLEEVLKPVINNDYSDIQRINLLEQGLLSILSLSNKLPSGYLLNALKIINLNFGTLSVNDLCNKTGLTARRLNREFERFLGISPKYYSRIVRFLNAFELIKNNKKAEKLISIAYDCGFFDQAHFVHEFLHFTGLAPSQFNNQC